MEVPTFAQTIAQSAEYVAIIADGVNSLNIALAGQQPDEFQQQTFGEQAVAGAGRVFNCVMRDIAARSLQSADDQLPLSLMVNHTKRSAG